VLKVAADEDQRVESVSKDNPRLTSPKTPASSTKYRISKLDTSTFHVHPSVDF
jgi:hypothetical protein